MRIKIYDDIYKKAISRKRVTAGNRDYFSELELMSKEPVEADTKVLFENSVNVIFNGKTYGIPEEYIEYIEDDVRNDFVKCNYCGTILKKTGEEKCTCQNPCLIPLSNLKDRRIKEEEKYYVRGYDWKGWGFPQPPDEMSTPNVSHEQLKMVFAKASIIAREGLGPECSRRIALPDGTATNYRIYRHKDNKFYIIGDTTADMPGVDVFIKFGEDPEMFPIVQIII